MDREELLKLQDAIGTILTWPPAVLDELLSGASKPNGYDHRPPVPAPRSAASKPRDNPAHARAAEWKLLASDARASGARRGLTGEASWGRPSTTKERLRRMGAQALIEKAPDGHWQVKAEEPLPTAPGEEPGPTFASPS
jgi:hypothetical protein